MAKNSEGLFSVIASIIISIALISTFPTIRILAHFEFPFAVGISQLSSGVNYKSSVIGKSEMATITALSILENKETRSNTSSSRYS